jgi:hypothetical protein
MLFGPCPLPLAWHRGILQSSLPRLPGLGLAFLAKELVVFVNVVGSVGVLMLIEEEEEEEEEVSMSDRKTWD